MRVTSSAMTRAAHSGGVLAVALVACLVPAFANAQSVSSAVVPETIHVGDVFHAAVRVELPAGVEAVFPDTLALPDDDIEAAGRVRVTTDTVGGTRVVTAAYPLTAWRSGEEIALPDVSFSVGEGPAQRVVSASFPTFDLASVLPADTSGIEPKPAKDVFGASRIWWPWLLAGLVALILAAVLFYLWRRRRARVVVQEPVAPVVSPREAALALLQQARDERLVERGALKPFYGAITVAVRGYLEAVDPELGADLTTTELARYVRARGAPPALLELLQLLGQADLVKFAKARRTATEAYGDWDTARSWVERYDGRMSAIATAQEAA